MLMKVLILSHDRWESMVVIFNVSLIFTLRCCDFILGLDGDQKVHLLASLKGKIVWIFRFWRNTSWFEHGITKFWLCC